MKPPETGILVKCAIADGRRLFLSSANLTEYAFTTNMELGILITGGKVPAEIQEHFDRLIRSGFLVPLKCDRLSFKPTTRNCDLVDIMSA